MRSTSITIVALLGISISAHAALLGITNGDFEDTSAGTYPDGPTAGWDASVGGDGSTYGMGIYNDATAGNVFLFNNGNASQVISQIVSGGIEKTELKLEFDLGNGPDYGTDTQWTKLNANLYARHPSTHELTLIGTQTIVRADEFSAADEWKHFSATYDASSWANYQAYVQIQVQGVDNSSTKAPKLDNVVLTEIPEPAALGLLGIAAGLLVVRRKLSIG